MSRVQAKYAGNNPLHRSYDTKTYRSSLASKYEDARSRLNDVMSVTSQPRMGEDQRESHPSRNEKNGSSSWQIVSNESVVEEGQQDDWHIVQQLQLLQDYERHEQKQKEKEEAKIRLRDELDR